MTNSKKSKGIKRRRENKRLRDEEEKTRYYQFFKDRAVKCEGNIELEDFRDMKIKELFEERQWMELCKGHEYASKELVREFYANLRNINRDTDTAEGYLRGIEFEFTPNTIATFYRTPRVHNPKFPYPKENKPSRADLSSLLCTNNGDKPRIAHKQLSLRCKLLHRILASGINQTGHTTHPTTETLHLMHALCRGEEIDIASYLYEGIIRVALKPHAAEGLPFGSFITRWAKSKKISTGAEEEKQMPPPTVNHRTRVFCEAHAAKNSGGAMDSSAGWFGDRKKVEDFSSKTTNRELMLVMESGFESIRRELEEARGEFQRVIDALRDDLMVGRRKRCLDELGLAHSSGNDGEDGES